ncbi:MAG: DEAD/DEAH box helicase family protein, partial [Verrucomicrobiota bacterium]
MSNFAFLPSDFRSIAEAATKAEGQIMGDPRAACFHARFTLETVVHWLYRHDRSLRTPYDQSLGALLHEPSFQNLLPEAVYHKARAIHKMGNQAVHSQRPVRQFDALQVVKELHHLCYWLVRTYKPDSARDVAEWTTKHVPRASAAAETVPRQELEKLEKQLAKQNEKALKQQQERDELDAELQALRTQLAEIREASKQQPDTHDYTEAETRRYLIDVDLRRAGWPLDQERDLEYEVTGMPSESGIGYVDYVLWGDDGKPLGLVEAKKTTVEPEFGQQQAKLYADCLEQMHGQRPVIFYTNGYTTWMWDDTAYPPRKVAGFYKKDELARLILRRGNRQLLDVAGVNDEIAGRYYQKRAIGSIFGQFSESRRKALLVMATGTGKTRTAIALVDVLQRAGWIKRALFLADRVSLVKQAANAFKKHLPDSSPVNLVTEKDTEGRVYVCTYPTMMGLIDETKGAEARFGVGQFDLVIIDEAHRSVYQKYQAIFRYFDSLLVGLTATPREQVDRNTYELFDLEPGVPTDAYELETAVADDFLVPPRAEQIDLRFPREGIDYDSLTEEEKERWESTDWGDDVEPGALPDRVNAAAINNWLFNKDTVDKVLQHLMERGHKVEGGDRLAKTIIFARNHDHAKFIEERFNLHYPNYAGHFARVIDNYAKYPQSLIDDFSIKEKDPHIAISVDMLDTGIDVPEVANLVFFKPVYSKIKFWQMIGRGTRLCEDLFGPDKDKQDFRVFDFCFNFDFFRENPDGIEGGGSAPLGTRIFRARVQLLGHVQCTPELDPDKALGTSLADGLHREVAAMNHDNFIVRMHLEAVERFQNREIWEQLSEADRETLQRDVADLPSEFATDDIESRLFDLTALRMQLAHVEADEGAFEGHRQRVVEIAMLLEEKTTIPAVAEQLEYLARVQEMEFWESSLVP